MNIQSMVRGDWTEVKRIYTQGIRTKIATFEQESPDWNEWDNNHRSDCRLVAIHKDKVIGWAAISNISERCVYDGVCEVSIYVDSDHRGKGTGDILMQELIEASETSGIWTLQAGIFPENQASINLHKKNGFREVGTREKIGKMDGIWRDVVLLERRSSKAGLS